MKESFFFLKLSSLFLCHYTTKTDSLVTLSQLMPSCYQSIYHTYRFFLIPLNVWFRLGRVCYKITKSFFSF